MNPLQANLLGNIDNRNRVIEEQNQTISEMQKIINEKDGEIDRQVRNYAIQQAKLDYFEKTTGKVLDVSLKDIYKNASNRQLTKLLRKTLEKKGYDQTYTKYIFY